MFVLIGVTIRVSASVRWNRPFKQCSGIPYRRYGTVLPVHSSTVLYLAEASLYGCTVPAVVRTRTTVVLQAAGSCVAILGKLMAL